MYICGLVSIWGFLFGSVFVSVGAFCLIFFFGGGVGEKFLDFC